MVERLPPSRKTQELVVRCAFPQNSYKSPLSESGVGREGHSGDVKVRSEAEQLSTGSVAVDDLVLEREHHAFA